MKKKSTKKSELAIIKHISNIFGFPADSPVIKGIGDDCAVLRKDDKSCFLVTTDTLVEGVHFDLAWHPPIFTGQKNWSSKYK